MSTNNFAYENRCVVVTDDDYEIENVPAHKRFIGNAGFRYYPMYELDDYAEQFETLYIVMTGGYYEGACIDFIKDEDSIAYQELDIAITEIEGEVLKELGLEENNGRFFENHGVAFLKALSDDDQVSDWFTDDELRNVISKYDVLSYNEVIDELYDILFKKESVQANAIIDKIRDEYGYQEVESLGSLSNGEAIYQLKK